jgi:hypothetical protein
MVNVTLQRVDLKDVKHYLFIIKKERKKSYFFLVPADVNKMEWYG